MILSSYQVVRFIVNSEEVELVFKPDLEFTTYLMNLSKDLTIRLKGVRSFGSCFQQSSIIWCSCGGQPVVHGSL